MHRLVFGLAWQISWAALTLIGLCYVPSQVRAQSVAQQSVPHAESCTSDFWGFLVSTGYEFGTVNICPETVSVWFLRGKDPVKTATVKSRGVFTTGYDMATYGDKIIPWVSATCPVGYEPRPPISQHAKEFDDNSYQCVVQNQTPQPYVSATTLVPKNFPLPKKGLTIQLRQVERGYVDFRETHRVTGAEGFPLSLRIESTQQGQPQSTLEQTMLFLVVENFGIARNSSNVCKITSDVATLDNLTIGALISYELDCTFKEGNQIVYTATQHVQRRIVSAEKITVAA